MNNVVIITGSNGGIGSSLVEEYLADGYIVFALDKTIKKTNNLSLHQIKINLENFVHDNKYRNIYIKSIKNNFPKDIKKFIIVNNAANQILKPIEKIDYNNILKSFDVNSFAPLLLIKSFVKELVKYQGHVINVSTIHSKITKENFTLYAASKAALDSFTRSLAIELSPRGISINSVSPAAIHTDMLISGFDDNKKVKQLNQYHPAGKIGSPQKLSKFIKFISENEDKFLTGSIIDYNGGIGIKLHDPS